MELDELLKSVTDEASLLRFISALREDRLAEDAAQQTSGIDACGRGPQGWENHTIEGFLEAALAWAESTNFGKTQGMSEANPWRRFAGFLYCGKIYE